MALEPHAHQLDIWMITTANSSNTTETSKHIILPLLRLKLLPDRLLADRLLLDRLLADQKLLLRKLLVDVDEPLDEPQYALHFLRSPTKQKEKRKNSRHGRRSGPTHLQMSLKTYTTLYGPRFKTISQPLRHSWSTARLYMAQLGKTSR
jgi:hypothetical protein